MSQKKSKSYQFWQELKRRRVIHVITVYASATFVIIELINNLTEPLNLPDNLATIVIVILAVGFPLAIILSWLYDLTGEGVEKTKPLEEVKEGEKTAVPNAWRIATIISFVIIIGLVTFNIIGGTKHLRAGDIKSLLILPFDNFTGDDQLDYVAAGMHSSLIGDMGQISSLRIISKTTANMYKNLDMSLPDIATELNADAVVEPTVVCYGDSVCIQIRVITPFPEEKQIWIAEYKEERSQIMNLYNRVTKQIANEVKVQLTSEEEQLLDESRIINSEAYDFYIKGLYYWDQFTPDALQLALEYFNKAIEKDPDWAEPYAGVAYFWVALHQFSMAPSSVTIPNIYSNLNKALELDPNSSFAHYINGLVAVWIGFEWDKGEREFLKVFEYNPNDVFGHMYYAHLLSTLRRIDEAVSHCRIALDLDPLNPMIQSLATLVLANAGEYEEAISMAKKVLAVVPNPVAIVNLCGIYIILEEYRVSLELLIEFYEFEDATGESILKTYDEHGFHAAMEEYNTELELATGDNLPMELGQNYAFLGDETKAMYWYEKAYEVRHPMLPYITTVYHDSGPFKIDDPAFDSLLLKLNLPLPEED